MSKTMNIIDKITNGEYENKISPKEHRVYRENDQKLLALFKTDILKEFWIN